MYRLYISHKSSEYTVIKPYGEWKYAVKWGEELGRSLLTLEELLIAQVYFGQTYPIRSEIVTDNNVAQAEHLSPRLVA